MGWAWIGEDIHGDDHAPSEHLVIDRRLSEWGD
jgi:hypothetical protein